MRLPSCNQDKGNEDMKRLHELLSEQFSGQPTLSWEGYRYYMEPEYEEDNIKNWHYLVPPGAVFDHYKHSLDHSPYEKVSPAAMKLYAQFHEITGRFPGRSDLPTNGPLNNDDIKTVLRRLLLSKK